MLFYRKKPRGIISLCLTFLCIIFGLFGCAKKENTTESIFEFHTVVTESQEYMDAAADNIYDYWYDAIYTQEYGTSDIDLALFYAEEANQDYLERIEDNDAVIQALYKKIKDSEYSSEIKAVVSAYTDYYELIVNVSGSFETYKEGKEVCKKALASALKDLAFEL